MTRRTAEQHRKLLAEYDRKRAVLLEGDCVVFGEGHYLMVACMFKEGRRHKIEGGMVQDGTARDVTVYTADVLKAIKAGAKVIRD